MNKFIAGVILGAAAGAALTAFLQTEKGKEILGDMKDAAGDASDNIKSHWTNFEKDLNSILKKGKQSALATMKLVSRRMLLLTVRIYCTKNILTHGGNFLFFC